MSFAIIQPKTKFTSNEVKVKGRYAGKNKLWKINGGELLLHYGEGETGFLHEIGINSFQERVQFLKFTEKEFKNIVQHFFQKDELRNIYYQELDEYGRDELQFLFEQLCTGKENDADTVSSFMEAYTYFVEEVAGEPWYITIHRDNQQLKLYPNGVMYAIFRDEEKTETSVLEIYAELFDLLGKPFVSTPVTITEKEATEHPLTNAHAFVAGLLTHSGENVQKQLNLSKEEVEKISETLLNYTKEFENKRIYTS